METLPITPERAREVIKQASQWPYWGNARRFLTDDEAAAVHAYWLQTGGGNSSFMSTLYKIAAPEKTA